MQARPARSRARLRLVLLVVIPLIALGVGSYFYLLSGRYISTDNAYVGAQKVLITPDISGKISRVMVAEGQRVNAGDALIEIDPAPFSLTVTQAEARLAGVRTEFANLKTNLASMTRRIALARESLDLKQRDVERKNTLLANRAGSQVDMDNALAAVVTAKTQLEQLEQQQEGIRNQLLGDPNLPNREVPAIRAGFRRARPGQARSRPHRAARADRRHGDAGRQPSRWAATSRPARRCSA